MLRNVLADFLRGATERQLDLPLLYLLPTLGFYDLRLVHGAVEIGRDIIAKRQEDGIAVQYTFQSKAGDLTNTRWQKEVAQQVFVAVTAPLPHPDFDRSLPHQVVVTTTGELKGNAPLYVDSFNRDTVAKLGGRPITVWGGSALLELFLDNNYMSLYDTALKGSNQQKSFFQILGAAEDAVLAMRTIEEFSRRWLSLEDQSKPSLWLAALEGSAIAQKCDDRNLRYEAIATHLAMGRTVLASAYDDVAPSELFTETLRRINELSGDFLTEIKLVWHEEKDLFRVDMGELNILTYPVLCSRVIEICGLYYFTAADIHAKQDVAAFLTDFVIAEPGAAHPVADRYAVSLICAVLVLYDSGHQDEAESLIRQTAIWLCDRYENNSGLARINADESEEIEVLLGSAFEFIDLPAISESLLASAIVDLCAFMKHKKLYEAAVNDFKVCRIPFTRFEPIDSVGALIPGSQDVTQYLAMNVADQLASGPWKDYCSIICAGSQHFRFVDKYGGASALIAMLLVRDRYFPTAWPLLMSSGNADDASAYGVLQKG